MAVKDMAREKLDKVQKREITIVGGQKSMTPMKKKQKDWHGLVYRWLQKTSREKTSNMKDG